MYDSGPDPYCYPGTSALNLRQQTFLRGLPTADFAQEAAHVLAELNAIHPFREGNGRTQLTYLTLLAAQAGHPLALERLDPAAPGSFHSRPRLFRRRKYFDKR